MSGILLQAAGVSHVGLVRAANEDSMVLRDDAGLWAVADGMGGLQHGKRASGEIATALESVQVGRNFHLDLEAITAAVQQANDTILLAAEQARAQMGTTIAVLHIFESSFAAVWVGDSRIYLSRGGRLHRLSQDHTQVQEMVDAGLLREEDARHHPRSHVLSRAVGVEREVRIDAVTDTVRIHDTFLICSDGLTCVVDDTEIGEALIAHGPQPAAAGLVELALARGAPDNVTVIVVRAEDS